MVDSIPSFLKESNEASKESSWKSDDLKISTPSPEQTTQAAPKVRNLSAKMRTLSAREKIPFDPNVLQTEKLYNKQSMGRKIMRNRIQTVLAEIAKSKKVDLCFLIDGTGSMTRIIETVKSSIYSILAKLKTQKTMN